MRVIRLERLNAPYGARCFLTLVEYAHAVGGGTVSYCTLWRSRDLCLNVMEGGGFFLSYR